MKTISNLPFPSIKAAVLIAGGSQFCYAYADESQSEFGVSLPLPPLPTPFEGCINRKKMGCCPKNITEQRFINSNYCTHPPTLLCQTIDDNYADPKASWYYWEKLVSNGVNGAISIGPGTFHGLVKEQMSALIGFIKYYI